MLLVMSIMMFIIGAITQQDTVLITSGLFSIAGAIEVWGAKYNREK